MSLDESIERLWGLVNEKIDQIPNLRIFLITEHQWLRVYKGHVEKPIQFEELTFIRNLKPERGAIINFFSKLEFLVNELIETKMLGLFSEKAYDFDLLLEYIDFSRRVMLLKKLGMINNNEAEKIGAIANVRNQLAHRWSEKEVSYGNGSISDNIQKFRDDTEKVWMNLISKYMIEEEKHIGRVIQKLEDPNTINLWAEMPKEQEEKNADDSERFSPSI